MGHIFLSFLFFNLILIVFYRHYKKGEYYIKKKDLVFYTILLIAFGVYGGGEGDYLAYKTSVEENFQSLFDVYYEDSFEIQYNYLAYIVGGNYNLWRLVIYSIQFIGMSWLLYKAKLNTYPFFICFISICLVMSVYGRAFWGAIYFFLGVYLLIERKNPLFLIIIALSYVSHTQNLALIALLPLAFIEFKRWHLLVIIIVFGTLVTSFQDLFTSFLDSGGVEGADHLNDKMQLYGQTGTQKAFGNSIGEVTIFILQHVPIVFLFLYLLKIFLMDNNRFAIINKPYRRVMSFIFALILISIIILISGIGSGALFYRVLDMVFFPITLLLPYLNEIGIIKKRTFKNIIALYIFVAELGYAKDLYYAFVGGRF